MGDSLAGLVADRFAAVMAVLVGGNSSRANFCCSRAGDLRFPCFSVLAGVSDIHLATRGLGESSLAGETSSWIIFFFMVEVGRGEEGCCCGRGYVASGTAGTWEVLGDVWEISYEVFLRNFCNG